MKWTQVSYVYDGTFFGFLTCVFDSYQYREEPADFTCFERACASFYPQRAVETRREDARRVYRSLEEKLGGEGKRWLVRGFLTCLPEKELWLWRFLRLGYAQGPGFTRNLADPVVCQIHRAVRHLEHEAHLYTGFVRFSQTEGALVGQITPKNRVLPLLRGHFCARFPQERFLLYDKTHREALVHQPGRWAIVPMDSLELDAPGAEEAAYRRLWRKFYDTIAIEGRENPRCRMTQMPKRYWADMTEFQTDEKTLPGR